MNSLQNTNPRVGIRLVVGPLGLEPGTKGLREQKPGIKRRNV